MAPRVTVLMPVYNGEKYLRESMESVLNQTFRDFEFLIIDDASDDSSLEIASGYRDDRIRIIRESHRGVAGTLNRGLELARGVYVARMDADDISLPARLEKQVNYMDANLDVDVCGAWVEMFDDDGPVKAVKYPCRDLDIKAELLFGSPLAHPSVVIRKKSLDNCGLSYSSEKAEDYELWARASKDLKFANLPEMLLCYRMGSGVSFNDQRDRVISSSDNIRKSVLETFFGRSVMAGDLSLHNQIARLAFEPSLGFIDKAYIWLKSIESANKRIGMYREQSLSRAILRYWLLILREYPRISMIKHPRYLSYALSLFFRLDSKAKQEFIFMVAGRKAARNQKSHEHPSS